MSTDKSRFYLKGLNGLRFLAALSVLIGHVELTKKYLRIPNHSDLFERINFGGLGVYFFFVLSGFLITYLLCIEKEKTKTISLKPFYVRRILRIWPLYYLVVIIGFLVLPQFEFFRLFYASFSNSYSTNLLLYALILPNLAFALNVAPVPHIGQAWSIGVEEQFYIGWPIIMKRSRNYIRGILVTLVIVLLVKATLLLLPALTGIHSPVLSVITKFVAMCKFESMLIGALAAVIIFEKKERIIRIIMHPASFWLSILLFPVLSYFTYDLPFVQDGIHIPVSIAFAVIIANVSCGGRYGFLESKSLNYLGQISYGIYMYHLILVFVAVRLTYLSFNLSGQEALLLAYGMSLVLTLVVSHFSYRYFELPFIRKKEKYSKILSNRYE